MSAKARKRGAGAFRRSEAAKVGRASRNAWVALPTPFPLFWLLAVTSLTVAEGGLLPSASPTVLVRSANQEQR
jgi:hypothetical protein